MIVNPPLRIYKMEGIPAVSGSPVNVAFPNEVKNASVSFVSRFFIRCKTATDGYPVDATLKNYSVMLNNGIFDQVVSLIPRIGPSNASIYIPAFRVFCYQLYSGISFNNNADPANWVYDVEIAYQE